MKKTIFIVDDSDLNLISMKRALSATYNVLTMTSIETLKKMLASKMPAVIILDIQIPNEDGFEGLYWLKSSRSYSHIPVIFVTGEYDTTVEERALSSGASEFIRKPVSPVVLLNRVNRVAETESLILDRTHSLEQIKQGLIKSMAYMVESKDTVTGDHVGRVHAYCKILLTQMHHTGLYVSVINEDNIEHLALSALLHDIGKVAIPDRILSKPDKLTTEEFDLMKTHTTAGASIINSIIENSNQAEFFEASRLFALYHHEKWDGTGYPTGKRGYGIPLHGRVLAIVDVYDALTSRRPYKEAMAPLEAMRLIHEQAGKHFDPMITQIFYENRELFF